MGRGGKGKKKAAAAAGLAPPQRANGGEEKKSVEQHKGIYCDKKVLACFFECFKPIRWIEIDPHCPASGDHDSNCFRVDDKLVLNSPEPDLDLDKLIYYGTVVSDSKAYFIGGEYQKSPPSFDYDFYDDDDPDKVVYSPKMFVYDLTTHKLKESLANLNVARSNPTVVLVEKYIYVFGGFTDSGFTNDSRRNHLITDNKHWAECLNLADYNNAKWEFLCPPPDFLFYYQNPVYHFVYERGSQIVFFVLNTGFYSFNYISKTWAPFRSGLCVCEDAYVKCYKVVVIDHLLFWHYLGHMYAYDLKNNLLVLDQLLDQVKVRFATRESYFFLPEATFIERIGKDTLILVVRDSVAERERGLHMYKFQIQNLTAADHRIRLVQIGSGVFPSPGGNIKNVLAI